MLYLAGVDVTYKLAKNVRHYIWHTNRSWSNCCGYSRSRYPEFTSFRCLKAFTSVSQNQIQSVKFVNAMFIAQLTIFQIRLLIVFCHQHYTYRTKKHFSWVWFKGNFLKMYNLSKVLLSSVIWFPTLKHNRILNWRIFCITSSIKSTWVLRIQIQFRNSINEYPMQTFISWLFKITEGEVYWSMFACILILNW